MNAVATGLSYNQFLERERQWQKSHPPLVFHDEVVPRYCPRCGSEVMVTLLLTDTFNDQTGQRFIKVYLDCPKFGIWPLTLHTKKVRSHIASQQFLYDLVYEATISVAAETT